MTKTANFGPLHEPHLRDEFGQHPYCPSEPFASVADISASAWSVTGVTKICGVGRKGAEQAFTPLVSWRRAQVDPIGVEEVEDNECRRAAQSRPTCWNPSLASSSIATSSPSDTHSSVPRSSICSAICAYRGQLARRVLPVEVTTSTTGERARTRARCPSHFGS